MASPQELFKRLSPSVVAVETLSSEDSVKNLGSGVVVAPDLVVTNRHVLTKGVKVSILQGRQACRAFVAWIDPDHDLGLLRVYRGEPEPAQGSPACALNAPPVSLRASPSPAVGERVYAIGTPEGLELTLSEGIISGLREFENGHAIQTSAAISPGSSGGGLFDAQGRLVGITTFFLDEGQNLNFALPAEWVQASLEVRDAREGDAAPKPVKQKGHDALFSVDEFMHNLGQFEEGGLLPDVVSSATLSAMWAISDGVVACLLDQNQKNPDPDDPDCSDHWPLWKAASIRMLELRGEIQGLESAAEVQDRTSGTDKYQNAEITRNMATQVRSAWLDLWEVYCQNRPTGIYTDLEGKIRACPGTH